MSKSLTRYWLSAFTLAAAVFSGCGPTRIVTLPAFDPHGSWSSSYSTLLGAASTYNEDPYDFTAAFINGFTAHDSTAAAFGPFVSSAFASVDVLGRTDESPAVLRTASTVRVRYTGGNYASVNVFGTTDERDYVRVRVRGTPLPGEQTSVNLYPGAGTAEAWPFLGSTGCSYYYTVWLALDVTSSYNLTGNVITRFDFVNHYESANVANPSCDDFMNYVQSHFDAGVESFENDGLFYSMVWDTVGADGFSEVAALDANRIFTEADILTGFQFDTAFRAAKFTSSTALVDANAPIEINSSFLRFFTVDPRFADRLFAGIRLNRNELNARTPVPASRLRIPAQQEFSVANMRVLPNMAVRASVPAPTETDSRGI